MCVCIYIYICSKGQLHSSQLYHVELNSLTLCRKHVGSTPSLPAHAGPENAPGRMHGRLLDRCLDSGAAAQA